MLAGKDGILSVARSRISSTHNEIATGHTNEMPYPFLYEILAQLSAGARRRPHIAATIYGGSQLDTAIQLVPHPAHTPTGIPVIASDSAVEGGQILTGTFTSSNDLVPRFPCSFHPHPHTSVIPCDSTMANTCSLPHEKSSTCTPSGNRTAANGEACSRPSWPRAFVPAESSPRGVRR